jgi:PEP-CTERM motif
MRMLTLFGPGGGFIDKNDDIDFATGNWDSQLSEVGLAPGTYTVALTQFNNDSNAYINYLATGSTSGNLSDGFIQAANPNFTLGFPTTPVGATGYFWDAMGVERNGNWAMDIVTTASIPEPSSLLLGGIGTLAGLGLVWKRRTRPAA